MAESGSRLWLRLAWVHTGLLHHGEIGANTMPIASDSQAPVNCPVLKERRFLWDATNQICIPSCIPGALEASNPL